MDIFVSTILYALGTLLIFILYFFVTGYIIRFKDKRLKNNEKLKNNKNKLLPCLKNRYSINYLYQTNN